MFGVEGLDRLPQGAQLGEKFGLEIGQDLPPARLKWGLLARLPQQLKAQGNGRPASVIDFRRSLAIVRAAEGLSPAARVEKRMFVTQAWAQGAGGATGSVDVLVQFLPFVFIFVILYALILRPQQKRMKQQQEMIGNLRRGDTVVTTGGLIGKIAKVVDENEIQVDLADNVRVRVVRAMIAEVRTKGEPVKEG